MNELATIETPSDVEQELPAVVTWARSLEITSAEAFAEAGERLKQIKGMAKRVTDFFAPMKRQADLAKKSILDAEKRLAVPLDDAEGLAKRAMLSYQLAEAAKAEAERRRLQAIADEQARKVREQAEREAARQRQIEADARAKAEAARLAAQEASATERKRLLAEAEAADRKAAAAAVKVEAKDEQAARVVAPIVHVAVVAPKVAGVTMKKVWTFEVVDALIIPREYLMIDEKKLGALARAMRDGVQVPGVRFFAEDSLASKGY